MSYAISSPVYHGHPTVLWQRTTPLIVSWFAGLTWRNNNKLYTQPRKLSCTFYNTHIIYESGRGPHILQLAGSKPKLYTTLSLHVHSKLRHYTQIHGGTRWRSWLNTALQAERSGVQFPKVSLQFFIDIIIPAALWPWG